MTEITTLQVGEQFTLFRELNTLPSDGSYFEALEDDSGFMMVTYLLDMSKSERDILRNEKIHTKMIREGNKVLFLNRYGNSPLIFEVSFDPTLYKDKRAMQIAFNNHMVMFVSIERRNGVIRTLRQANFPMKLKQGLITAWDKAFKEENYSENYTKWLNQFYVYDLFQLWDQAESVGAFGEKGIFE